jgi:uncharacterized membrane protein
MPLAVLITVTAIVFLLADALMIPLVMRPLFVAHLGGEMLDSLRLGPAALFYAVHIGGLVHFAGLPALRMGKPAHAVRDGALLGLVAYSCYEMTSWTIMRSWRWQLVAVDLAWGVVISGAAAGAGVLAVRRLKRA